MKKHKHIWAEYNVFTKKWIEEDDGGLQGLGRVSGNPYSLKCRVCGIYYTQTKECKLRETTFLEVEIPEKIEKKIQRIINREVKQYYKKLK